MVGVRDQCTSVADMAANASRLPVSLSEWSTETSRFDLGEEMLVEHRWSVGHHG